MSSCGVEKLSGKNERVLSAAEDIFVRYGFARTTMGDIAKAAGISRPALYLMFPDKEAIFTRVIEMMDARSLDRIQSEVDQIASIDQKLLQACVAWGLHGVELAQAHPDAADLFDLRFSAVRQVYERFHRFLIQILQNSTQTWELPVSQEEFAETLTYGLRGLRSAATDADHMRRLIEVHVTVYGLPLRKMEGARRRDGQGPFFKNS